jgi:two-component system nitrate/nitrite response regulator NarL
VTSVTVVLADDHPVYREGLAGHLRQLLNFTLLGVCSDGPAALTMITAVQPDVAVVDLKLPGATGLEVLQHLQTTGCATKVLILSAYVDSETVYRAVAAGAGGYLEKSASFKEIVDAILAVASGETVIAPMVNAALALEIRERDRGSRSPLTQRETAVLSLGADGLSTKQIAHELGISLPTVKTHLAHIYDKLGVPDRASAVAQAFRSGLLN